MFSQEQELEGQTGRLIKTLAWISREVIQVKADLDKHYITKRVTSPRTSIMRKKS